MLLRLLADDDRRSARRGCTTSSSTRGRGRGSITTSRSCPGVAGEAGAAPTSIRRARPRRRSRRGCSRCRPTSARRRPASSPTIRRDARPAQPFALVPYSLEYQGELARAAALLREAAALTHAADAEARSSRRARPRSSPTTTTTATSPGWSSTRRSSRPSAPTRSTRTSGSTTRRRSRRSSPCATTPRRDKLAALRRRAAGHREPPADRPALRNPEARRAGADPRGERVFAAGDGNRGVQTAAFNLPNDERVVSEKGTKRVMLKNMQEAKFRVLLPIAKVALSPADQPNVVVRRVLHAHPDARADARPRPAQHHRRRPRRPRCGRS